MKKSVVAITLLSSVFLSVLPSQAASVSATCVCLGMNNTLGRSGGSCGGITVLPGTAIYSGSFLDIVTNVDSSNYLEYGDSRALEITGIKRYSAATGWACKRS